MHVVEQLEFDFDIDSGLGSLAEAKEIFDAVGDSFRQDHEAVPPGWTYVSSGGTRKVYLSPTGIAYKVCYDYSDDEHEPTWNDLEYLNLKRIRREGKLPPGWKVPRTQLHVFQDNITRWVWTNKKEESVRCRVTILAMDYIYGQTVGGWDNEGTPESLSMEEAFRRVGLGDVGGKNAIKTPEGDHYIIDAAEEMLPEERI